MKSLRGTWISIPAGLLPAALEMLDGATDNHQHVFERDLQSHATTLVSRADGPGGAPADDTSLDPAINADGSFTYDPPVSFNGTDTFTYTATTSGGRRSYAA